MRTKTIRQTINFKASPKEVYEILMDSKKHAEITDSEVTMSKKIKGKFSAFGGYCKGYNIELQEGEKIIQAWNFDEYEWPEEHFSICTFLFEKTDAGTKLSFVQKGVPAQKYEDIKNGWHQYYWTPMKDFIDNQKHIR
jgi:activator of HSP90 ATPase